jgi:RimJ/RimL family protein N-acetyltransferase
MAGMIDEELARERVRELLRGAEERRARTGGPSARRGRSARRRPRGRVLLPDGRIVRVRTLRREDRRLYTEAVAALSERSRYLRFAAPVPALSESMLDRMMDFDETSHVAIGAFAPGEENIVGVARLVAVPASARTGEVAIAVADAWQRARLGSVLLAAVIERARRIRLQRLVAVTLGENHVAGRLARASGFAAVGAGGQYREYRLEL